MAKRKNRKRRCRGKRDGRFTVKVQYPLGGDVSRYLVYDRERTFQHFIPIGDLPELDDAMKESFDDGTFKRYYTATWLPGDGQVDRFLNILLDEGPREVTAW